MAQIIVLKRSAQPNKKPETGSLNLGEIAVNTYDGKAFIKRSGSVSSVEEFVITNAINTGSITLTQTGSFGELIVTNDANIQRDLYVTRDIISNGDIDAGGDISGSNLLLLGNASAVAFNGTINANNGVVSGSSQLTASYDERYVLSASFSDFSSSVDTRLQNSSAGAGPNTFDFNLDPNAAGTVNYIEDSTSTTRIFAHENSASVVMNDNTIVSINHSVLNVTTGSNTANFMYLVKYITAAGDLDFNV